MFLSNRRRLQILHFIRPYLRNPYVDRGKWFLLEKLNPKPGEDLDCIRLGVRATKVESGAHILCDFRHAADRFTYFTGEYELGASRLMRSVLSDRWTFIDVGANVGKYMVMAAPLAGEVICVEPNPVSRWFLSSNVAINGFRNVKIHPFALGEQDGDVLLSQMGDDIGGASIVTNREQGFKVPVPVRRGDSVLQGEGPVYLKIDVEGYEEQVLRGFTRLLAGRQCIVQVEITDKWLQQAGGSADRLFSLMSDHGFTPFLIGTKSTLRTTFLLTGLNRPLNQFQYDVIFLPKPSLQEFLASLEPPFPGERPGRKGPNCD